MSRFNDPTPCPASRKASTMTNAQESGTILFAKTALKRPQSSRLSAGWNPSADILLKDTSLLQFEVGASRSEQSTFSNSDSLQVLQRHGRRSSFLAQPPQRLNREKAQYSEECHPVISRVRSQNYDGGIAPTCQENCKGRRISSLRINPARIEVAGDNNKARKGAIYSSNYDKNPRRRTIYVPSDDTTFLTIHPGALENGSDVYSDLPMSSKGEEKCSQISHRRQQNSRKSLALNPRRGPLLLKPAQNNYLCSMSEMPGNGTGKENVPPTVSGISRRSLRAPSIGVTLALVPEDLGYRTQNTKISTSTPVGSTYTVNQSTSLLRRQSSLMSGKNSSDVSMGTFQTKIRNSPCGHTAEASIASGKVTLPEPGSLSSTISFKSGPLPKKTLLGVHKSRGLTEKYPVLAENVSNPEMYDENWLSDQEIAISQLLNCLLGRMGKGLETLNINAREERNSMLKIYNDTSSSLLYKRLQASLLYGALSIPRETLSQKVRIKEDLAQRRRFLDLWLRTYDLSLLQAALEVVTGRILQPSSMSQDAFGSASRSISDHSSGQSIEEFLNIFLICNDDKCHRDISTIFTRPSSMNDNNEAHTRDWQRTVLRSLMLILLLDKSYAQLGFNRRLFQVSSPYKSSVAVLQGLSRLLLPSTGDIARLLAHLDYHVHHVQHPLEEYNYTIQNIATDFRDGVILARLVEKLFNSPTGLGFASQAYLNMISDGEAITNARDISDPKLHVLSQHLKYPTISRSLKLHNVQIVLDRLQDIKGFDEILRNLKADDIVDGHREKTLGLLWVLIAGRGLEALLDFELVESEIKRLEKRWLGTHPHGTRITVAQDHDHNEFPGPQAWERLTDLQLWAQKIARKHGLQVSNLSTSFADGKIYTAIIREYDPCLVRDVTWKEGRPCKDTDADTLKSLGCFGPCIGLFQGKSMMPSPRTVVPQLAFLASRLLPMATKYHSAVTLQSCWRRYSAERMYTKRLILAKLAKACATIVQTRERIVSATITLQRRWKQILLARPRHERPP